MHDLVLTVFAVTSLLGLVSLLLPLAERLSIPYAVLLAAVGCALGGAVGLLIDGARQGLLGDTLRAFAGFGMTADAFLYIFLPALLFETALNVDVRRLTDEIAPVLLLAVIGVLVSTAIVGLALWPIAGGVPLVGCLLLGAILATTDPVAVVAIFRDIGAPRRLSTLVEGESLFNDAAAIALFTLLAAMLTGERETGPLHAFEEFLRDFAGGLVFGYVAGRIACLLLPMLRDHRLAETTLTLAFAYLTFVLGERYVDVSGVVATVTAGLVVSSQGRRRLSPSSWDNLARSWEQIGFWATSLIFLLAAMAAPGLLAHADLNDLLLLGVVIAAAIAARALTLFGLLPLLSAVRLAQKVETSQKLVILWGGMRGAVSLALALAATENAELPYEIRQFVGVLATGFVLFTLFAMAPTLRPLMRILGLDRLAPAELAMRNRVMTLALSTINEEVDGIARDHAIPDEVTMDATARYRRHANAASDLAEENAQIPAESRLHTALVILVEREREFYMEYFEERTMSRRAVATLLAQVTALRDAVKTGGIAAYRESAARNLAFTRGLRVSLWLHRMTRLERPLAQRLADRFEVLLATRLVLGELQRFAERQLQQLFGAGPFEILQVELSERQAAVDQAIAALMLQYPNYARALQMQFLKLTAIRLEEARYRQLCAESVISMEVFNDLQRELSLRRRQAEQRPRLDLGLRRNELVGRVALFAGLPEERRRRIARVLKPRLAMPGEAIIRQGERGDSMFFISSGAVEVRIGPKPVRLGTGDFVGEIALLTRRPRTADVVALGYCQLLTLTRRDLRILMRKDDELRRQIASVARQRLRSSAATRTGDETEGAASAAAAVSAAE